MLKHFGNITVNQTLTHHDSYEGQVEITQNYLDTASPGQHPSHKTRPITNRCSRSGVDGCGSYVSGYGESVSYLDGLVAWV